MQNFPATTIHHPSPPPTLITISDPNNPYPTTFVQADTTSFNVPPPIHLHSTTTTQHRLHNLVQKEDRNKTCLKQQLRDTIDDSFDDNRIIDIEACPICHQLRQVYDCPATSCDRKHITCRACTFCIPRCTSCGCCFNERDYIETFCLDLMCLNCLTQILRFPDGKDGDISIRGFHQLPYQQAMYHLCLYG
ncbi:hypothetical protein QVD17_17683 [Tagetes erecta]|uniref:Uncharacterized protein n=1 Tax=Tagetes erecta TaxID=13708 RepID=A0AAD8KWI7_TARER|nr:hypothetical protein QVD17_17683 [Tagetes erecta]